MKRSSITGLALATAVLGASIGGAGVLAGDAADDAHVALSIIPRGAEVAGEPYEHWIREYGQWFFWDRTMDNPPPDATQDCDGGQPGGPVFFIPHTQIGSTTSYTCNVRSDQHVLLWVGGTLGWVEDGQTAADRVARHFGDPSRHFGFEITVDGVSVPAGDKTIFQPDLATVELAADNVFGIPPGPREAFVSGSFVMLEPLTPGVHEITVQNSVFDPERGTAEAIAISGLTVSDVATANAGAE